VRRFEWFEFGLVRGLIGLIIAGITMLLLSLSLNAHLLHGLIHLVYRLGHIGRNLG